MKEVGNDHEFSIKKRNGVHYLYEGDYPVEFINSPNYGGVIKPKFLVIHYTAGSSKEGAVNWFARKASRVSAHFVIDIDGSITQMVSLNRKAFHAGRSRWKGYRGLNSHSIGIEVVNPGPLKKIHDTLYETYYGKKIFPESPEYDRIIEARHRNGGPVRPWLQFSPEQIYTLLNLGSFLMEAYKLKEAVGHDMISPGRKIDPGPCLPDQVYSFLNRGSLNDDDDGIYHVTADKLNMREAPNGRIIKVLSKGDQIEDYGEPPIGNWIKVIHDDDEGFVHMNWISS